jgi:pimeloyl-ACP methyl ester carboxylesterase
VSLLLQNILQTCDAKVSLVGHSYGCIVMLSAVAAIPTAALPRKTHSMLLLQPAVSQYCFAAHVPGKPHGGGYRVVFGRVHQPILSTYSAHDLPLTKLFHLAARRADDLGQPKIAADGAPSQYAALGGYGPAGCLAAEYTDVPIPQFKQPYTVGQPEVRLIALKADSAIKGHGDISVAATWWALHQQIHAA